MLLHSKHSGYVALKSKICGLQKWMNLEKHPPYPQFSSKLSEIFFGERFEELGSFFLQVQSF